LNQAHVLVFPKIAPLSKVVKLKKEKEENHEKATGVS